MPLTSPGNQNLLQQHLFPCFFRGAAMQVDATLIVVVAGADGQGL